MQNSLSKLESLIGYSFTDQKYLYLALTHPSYANENNIKKECTNQRLEFLGDSVLELISSEYLYNLFPNYDEGMLTKLRAKLVCEENLANVAVKLDLHEYLLIGKGEKRDKVKINHSIMCDAIEAIIGAIYLDGGKEETYKFVVSNILTDDNINKSSNDYKSRLQELANSKYATINYTIVYEKGPDHNKEFCINLYYNDKILGSGVGKSKKDAEQCAANEALQKLLEENRCI